MLPDGIEISPGLKLVVTASGAPAAGSYSPGKALGLDSSGNLYAYITGDTWGLIGAVAAGSLPDPVTVAYTDETNTARTTNLSFQSLTGTIGITAGAAGAFEGIPLHIRCKASTTITFAATVSLFTGTYNAEGCAMEVA